MTSLKSLKTLSFVFLVFCFIGSLSGFVLFKNDIHIIQNTKAAIIQAQDQIDFEDLTITRRVRYIDYDTNFDIRAPLQKTLTHISEKASNLPAKIHSSTFEIMASTTNLMTASLKNIFTKLKNTLTDVLHTVENFIKTTAHSIYSAVTQSISALLTNAQNTISNYHNTSLSGWMKLTQLLSAKPEIAQPSKEKHADFKFVNILSYEPAAGDQEPLQLAEIDDSTKPTSELSPPPIDEFKYELEDTILEVEGVLVPQNTTVISSSRDGQIAKIYFDNGDMFQKGDILIEYVCEDVKAELAAAEAEKQLTQKRTMRNEKLLKLDIISDIEHLGFKTEDVKASAQTKIAQQRMEQCYIRAAYDGRVTNRLANAYEFTRTDRVLIEVASLDDLEVEFLVPSLWLRWVNKDAPVSIAVNETAETYDAIIRRIYGEIDPISQSIQMTATLAPYESPLLPGMSGTITIDIERIREAGIKGFLEQPRFAGSKDKPEQ